MATKTVDNAVAALEKILSVFTAKPNFTVGEITKESLTATIAGLRAKNTDLENAKATAARLVNEITADLTNAGQVQTRGLSGIRAAFGPDSSEYEQAGGVRSSERKPRTKQTKT
jgi:hypothetical protein